MQQKSFWVQNEQPAFPVLRGRRNADAVVIGGGLSGLTVALWLSKAGLRVILLEARTLGSGASSRCAGMASLSNGLFYDRVERRMGLEVAAAYAQTQLSAFQALRDLAREQGEAVGWRDIDAYVVGDSEKEDGSLAREAEAMRRAGINATLAKPTQCPLPASQSILMRDMATLHPIRYLRQLARQAQELGLKVFEQSRVTALETNLVYTERGSVLAPYLVVATGYPVVNTPGWYFLRMTQRQGYLAPLEGGAAFGGMYFDANGRYALRRLREGMLLQMDFGRVGTRVHDQPEKRFQEVYAPYLEGARPGRIEGGIDAYSADGLPYIGAYSKKTPNLFVASGYGGRGLIGSMVAAQAISAKILGLPGEGYGVYSGQRRGAGVFSDECKTLFSIGGRYLRGMTRVHAPRCPHLGCKLVYRPQSRMWECPCHGSRFDDIGHVLNAPAIHDAPIHHRRGG